MRQPTFTTLHPAGTGFIKAEGGVYQAPRFIGLTADGQILVMLLTEGSQLVLANPPAADPPAEAPPKE